MPPSSSVPPATSAMRRDSLPLGTKVVATLLVLVLLGGLYYWYTSSQGSAPAPAAAIENRPASVRNQQPAQPAPAVNTDTSNAALVKDSAAIDAQLTGLSSDTSSMGAADQPVPQAY